MKEILIRFDDICPTMNWQQWNRAKAILDRVGAKALLGVIPDCRDKDLLIDAPKDGFWDYVKELQSQGYSIAMHGYWHVFDIHAAGIATPKKHSEFAGHPYEVQFEKIRKGKDILLSHGIETDVFFAPAHSYDDNTLKALAANGFKYISDGLSKKPYKRNGIICIPARSGGVPNMGKPGFYTAVFHAHEWERAEKAYSYNQLKNICENMDGDIVGFDILKNRPCGNSFVQCVVEKSYKTHQVYIVPLLSRIRKIVKQ